MPGTCSIDGCDRGGKIVRGWCMRHYHRWHETGSPTGTNRPSAEERFWSQVDVRGDDDCWLWTGWTDPHGYGRIGCETEKGHRPVLAHRFSLGLAQGPLGDACALHHCDNPPCVNPAHLYAGTKRDNTHDAFARGRLSRDPDTGRMVSGVSP